jgi:hypothetical protein
MFGQPLVAVADGRVRAAIDGHPDLPSAGTPGTTWRMKQGSLRGQVDDQVRRGQVIGQVGDSGNSDEPDLHIQVQNKPTFDVEDRDLRIYPILFDGATVSDVRRADAVRPLA